MLLWTNLVNVLVEEVFWIDVPVKHNVTAKHFRIVPVEEVFWLKVSDLLIVTAKTLQGEYTWNEKVFWIDVPVKHNVTAKHFRIGGNDVNR